MNIYRKTAIIAGILFIVATAASLVSTGFTQSILDSPDYLIKIAATENQVILGVLFQFIAAATSAAIAISLYPILRKYNEGLARGRWFQTYRGSVLYCRCTRPTFSIVIESGICKSRNSRRLDFSNLGNFDVSST